MFNHYTLTRFARDHVCDLIIERRSRRRFRGCQALLAGVLR
jgi:hypothetical protein